MIDPHETRLELAFEVLDGLSVGDALGEALSYQCYRVRQLSDFSAFPNASVRYTDDTEMALAVVDVLRSSRAIDEDLLAWRFATRFRHDPDRGYGRMARQILRDIGSGATWRMASGGAFGGCGSFGNGAAMRVAPLGAYFFDEPGRIPEMAERSAQVTHCHPLGIAGAIAVAVATGCAVSSRDLSSGEAAEEIWQAVLASTPPGEVRERLAGASRRTDAQPAEIARSYGNGAEISAQDTVPFCIWNACRCLGDYTEAILSTIEIDGDCDTNAAIVGGIVTGYLGRRGIPSEWLRVRERLH